MELWRQKNQQITRSTKPNALCKKHPKHQQSPGICSICLNEKLSQLYKNSNKKRVSSISYSSSLSSSPSQCSSCASSSCSSPVRGHMASEMRSGPLIFARAGRNELIKSRSMAAVTQRSHAGKKKISFWSKLLHPKGKRIKEEAGNLMHSRTLREMLTARAH